LASHTEALFRFGDDLRRQPYTLEKRRYRHAGAFEARDRQAGKASFAIGIEAKSCSEFRA
jgi:hypothetical protein